MTKNELVKIITDNGLEWEAGNSYPNHLLSFWLPWNEKSGRVTAPDGKSKHLLEMDIKELAALNKKFENIIKACIAANIPIFDIHTVEFGVISQVTVVAADGLKSKDEQKEDFELSSAVSGKPESIITEYLNGLAISYNDLTSLIKHTDIPKKSVSLVVDQVIEYLKGFSDTEEYVRENIVFLMSEKFGSNYSIAAALDKKILTKYKLVDYICNKTGYIGGFDNDVAEIFFSYMSKLTIEEEITINIVTNENANIIKEYQKQIFKNWRFDQETITNLITHSIDNTDDDFIYRILNVYKNEIKPSKQWVSTTSIFNISNSLVTRLMILFKNVDFTEYDLKNISNIMLGYLGSYSSQSNANVYTVIKYLALNNLISLKSSAKIFYDALIAKDKDPYSNLAGYVFDIFRGIVDNLEEDDVKIFYILAGCDDSEWMQTNNFYSIPEVIERLINDGKEDRLPQSAKDVFIF